jgi:hypothetical protein
MKIVYLFTSPSLNGSSVQTKVLNQIKYLNLAGAECRGAFFSTEVKYITHLNEQVDLIPVQKCNWKYFRASGQKRNTMLAVLRYAKSKFQDIDLFYFRYPGAGSLLARFIKLFGSKTVFEHLSIEEKEIQLQAKENPFGLRPSTLLWWLEYTFLPLWREKYYGRTIRKNSKLGICNSQEIADWQNSKSGGFYKGIVGGDAVEIQGYPLLKRPVFEEELKLVFLKGASTSADFNGLDRIIKSIKGYRGDTKIKLYILGHQLKAEEEIIKQLSVEQNIILLTAKSGKELFSFLEEIHMGTATLGLYRKGLDATTTIKVREYTALGLPFIYAYTDPDLNEDSKGFALEFFNDDSLIDMEKVIEFAKKALEDKELPHRMRKYAEEHLDYEVKMKKLYVELLKLKNA